MNETMMNALAALFEKHRIVFWYCEDPLLVADFEACAMPTVEKRDITGHPLATKVEVLLERPKDKFLLFCRGPRPADEENFLIDVLLANAEFQTDKASLLATDLGLGPEATPVIKSCMGFFAAAKRVQELKSRLKDGGTENLEGLVDLAQSLLEFLFTLQPDFQTEIIRHLTTSYTPSGIISSMNTSRFGLAIPLYCL